MKREDIENEVNTLLGTDLVCSNVLTKSDGNNKTLSLLLGSSEFIFAYFRIIEGKLEYSNLRIEWLQINILSVLGFKVDEKIEVIKQLCLKWNGV